MSRMKPMHVQGTSENANAEYSAMNTQSRLKTVYFREELSSWPQDFLHNTRWALEQSMANWWQLA